MSLVIAEADSVQTVGGVFRLSDLSRDLVSVLFDHQKKKSSESMADARAVT